MPFSLKHFSSGKVDSFLFSMYIAVLKKVRYALCPMPYALCPMPYARRVPHVTEKGYRTHLGYFII